MAEAFQNARHVLPAGVRAPFVIGRGHFASGLRILHESDLALHVLLRYGGVVCWHFHLYSFVTTGSAISRAPSDFENFQYSGYPTITTAIPSTASRGWRMIIMS